MSVGRIVSENIENLTLSLPHTHPLTTPQSLQVCRLNGRKLQKRRDRKRMESTQAARTFDLTRDFQPRMRSEFAGVVGRRFLAGLCCRRLCARPVLGELRGIKSVASLNALESGNYMRVTKTRRYGNARACSRSFAPVAIVTP